MILVDRQYFTGSTIESLDPSSSSVSLLLYSIDGLLEKESLPVMLFLSKVDCIFNSKLLFCRIIEITITLIIPYRDILPLPQFKLLCRLRILLQYQFQSASQSPVHPHLQSSILALIVLHESPATFCIPGAEQNQEQEGTSSIPSLRLPGISPSAQLDKCVLLQGYSQGRKGCKNVTHRGSGRASLLMKPGSKRKRTKAELEEVKQEESLLKEDKQRFLQNVKRLRQEQHQLQQIAAAYRNNGVGQMDDEGDEEEDDAQPQFNI